jgi:hypothetical protein
VLPCSATAWKIFSCRSVSFIGAANQVVKSLIIAK